MNTDTAAQLLKKYSEGKCDPKEELLVNRWYIDEASTRASEDPADPITEHDLIWKGLQDQLSLKSLPEKVAKPARVIPMKWAVAASLFLVASCALIYLAASGNRHELLMAEIRKNDIAPGGNSATLTLPSGEKVSLSSSKTGVVIDATALTYDDGTSLAPSLGMNGDNDKEKMSISTPPGGQYQVKLPDGTRVWMNAASSVIFPARFSADERRIFLTGEAYFEVSKNDTQPFIVQTAQQEVIVLGTHFNINAYTDEPAVRTTLLEGSVRVSSSRNDGRNADGDFILLKPGQQAALTASGIKLSKANPEEVISWKNGKFRFSDESIESLMRKVSRWYNVKVEYQGKITKEKFGGQVSKFNKVSDILEVLQLTGFVHFKIEGPNENGAERRIIVLP